MTYEQLLFPLLLDKPNHTTFLPLEQMDLRSAINTVFDRHGIRNKDIDVAVSARYGKPIGATTLSRFRNGKREITTDTLDQLLSVLTEEQRNEIFQLLIIHNSSADTVSGLIVAAAQWFRTEYNTKQYVKSDGKLSTVAR